MKYEFEEWKKIEGFETAYVSNYGRFKYGNGKIRKGSGRYRLVTIYENGKYYAFSVHRLVAKAFIPNPYKLPEVNHKDENPANNCVWNLEWCTKNYNLNYGTRNKRIGNHKTKPPKETIEKAKQKNSKPVLQYTLDGEFVAEYPSAREASRQTGINVSNIVNVCNNKQKKRTDGRYYTCKSAGNFLWKWKEVV